MDVPGDEEIRALHVAYAPTPEAFELVYTHCEIVCRIAERLAARLVERRGPVVDVALVRAGCLLHDIGVYRLYGPSGKLDGGDYLLHGMLGHDLLAGLGFPDTLCRFCSCHTGVGLTRDDVRRQGLPLPPGDYVPETVEEELVLYADKFHSKTTPPTFVAADTYAARVGRFGADKRARFAELRARYGEPDLADLRRTYGHATV